jgi:hypothetical protein
MHGYKEISKSIEEHYMSGKTLLLRLSGMVAMLAFGGLFAQQASAGCAQIDSSTRKIAWQTPGEFFGAAKLQRVDDRREEDEYASSFFHAPIVGLWSFKYLSEGNAGKPVPINFPNGMILDHGNTQFYADGNEVTYSGMRDPTTGATCLGIWKRTGEFTYELNHIGLSWNPPGNPMGAPVGEGGPAFIKQTIVLARDGNSYTGSFSIRQLLPDGKTLATPAAITGKIEATRVTMNTTTQLP